MPEQSRRNPKFDMRGINMKPGCRNCSDKEHVNGPVPAANFLNQRFWGWPHTYGLMLA